MAMSTGSKVSPRRGTPNACINSVMAATEKRSRLFATQFFRNGKLVSLRQRRKYSPNGMAASEM
jgi:hypothetical protein